MILYESSKCFHGRPKRFNGTWYSSIFTHYYPQDWDAETLHLETHYRVPPGWELSPHDADMEELDELIVSETSFREPNCEHEWCALSENTKKWKRPEGLKFEQIMSADGVIKPLEYYSEDEL